MYTPALQRHPLHPERYAELHNQRTKVVGQLMYVLEVEYTALNKHNATQRYKHFMAIYKQIMDEIHQLEEMEELVSLNTDNK